MPKGNKNKSKFDGGWASIMPGWNRQKSKPKNYKCQYCFTKFGNAGALKTHINIKHPLLNEQNKDDKQRSVISQLQNAPPSDHTNEQNTAANANSGDVNVSNEKNEKESASQSSNHTKQKKTRHNLGADKKWWYIQDYDEKKSKGTYSSKEEYAVAHNLNPSSFRNWTTKKKRNELKEQAKMIGKVAKSKRNFTWLEKNKQGKYPEIEKKLQKIILDKRMNGFAVHGTYIKLKMKLLVNEANVPDCATFKASNGWLAGFLKRHRLTSQKKTNKKNKSVKERIPKVRKFHQYAVYGINAQHADRDPKYGRFAAKDRYHMDQVCANNVT